LSSVHMHVGGCPGLVIRSCALWRLPRACLQFICTVEALQGLSSVLVHVGSFPGPVYPSYARLRITRACLPKICLPCAVLPAHSMLIPSSFRAYFIYLVAMCCYPYSSLLNLPAGLPSSLHSSPGLTHHWALRRFQQEFARRALSNNYRRPIIGEAEDFDGLGRVEVGVHALAVAFVAPSLLHRQGGGGCACTSCGTCGPITLCTSCGACGPITLA